MSTPQPRVPRMSMESRANDDAPTPLTDEERRWLKRMFSDFFEVPGTWKTDLKAELERDPPVLGKGTLGGQAVTPTPDSVTTLHIVDGTIQTQDLNDSLKDGPQNVPTMRTLGTGHQQAAPGDDPRFASVGGDKSYVHTQGALSATWVVVHNLGKFVSVEVVDTGDSVILPNIHYDSLNQVTLTFAAATSGKAYIN